MRSIEALNCFFNLHRCLSPPINVNLKMLPTHALSYAPL